ncbi:mannosyltransferase [Tulasnella sp. 419]|nr:mannosyltransferase [Tulasnella sp. 419]
MSAPNIETIRFAKPAASQNPSTPKPRHQGLLQDQLRRSNKPILAPSLSVAFRMIMLVRAFAAMYSLIQDADEVFNFWEPLHYFDQNHGFQTWELSPRYAVRSWAYIVLHWLPLKAPVILNNTSKRAAFFALRLFLAAISSFCEAKFYRAIVDNVNDHVGRYALFFMLFSTGMYNAATALLPSTFAMYTNMLAYSYAMQLPSRSSGRRAIMATGFFAAGAIIGWPFSLAVAIPFVIEELFTYGSDHVKPEAYGSWMEHRWRGLINAGAIASLLFIPVIAIDTLAYGRVSIVPWNIVRYNIFHSDRGPDLYGTEPWHFYVMNLLLNFNLALPLALAAFPALLLTYRIQNRRVGITKPGADDGSPYVSLGLRLAPVYLWLGIFTAQAHKEERFMYPIYPLICFNAAVALYLFKSWAEVAYTKATSSYQASKTGLFSNLTLWTILFSGIISFSRIMAIYRYYHAPFAIVGHLEFKELPRVLNATNLLIVPDRSNEYAGVYVQSTRYEDDVKYDLSPLKIFGGLRLCYGKEWYRFPSHFHVPEGVEVRWIKSGFDGMLPALFAESKGGSWPWVREKTREIPEGLNDLNKEEPRHYVPVETCDYLVDSDFPSRLNSPSMPPPSPHEPRYVLDEETWDKVVCVPFLDAQTSGRISRLLWVPDVVTGGKGLSIGGGNQFGDYCLLRNKVLAHERESKKWA